MTIPTSSQPQKSQDCVESDVICVIPGVRVRRYVYLICILLAFISAAVLYLLQSTVVIIGFAVLQILLLIFIYPLAKFVMKTEEYDVIWDSEGFHWFRQSDVTAGEHYEQPHHDVPSVSTEYHLNYMFI